MHSAIIIDDGHSKSAILATVEQLKSVKTFADILVASTCQTPKDFTAGTWICCESLVSSLAQAASAAVSKRLLVISSSVTPSATELSTVAPEIENRSVLEHVVFGLTAGGTSIEIPKLAPESVVNTLANCESFPYLFVATSRYALSAVQRHRVESVSEFITQALVMSISDGDIIKISKAVSPEINSDAVSKLSYLSSKERSRCLQTAIDGLNIEELFPEHNWSLFGKESAAASYHSLAAIFLSLGDTESAAQCLACSEKLEESPRYFALQGLIHQAQGETLGAVANLVSSLQAYEARKNQDDSKHYMTFKPSSLEIIKTRMAQGLEALTKRDNAKAFESFSDAVFQFDSFYSEHGVKNPAAGEE